MSTTTCMWFNVQVSVTFFCEFSQSSNNNVVTAALISFNLSLFWYPASDVNFNRSEYFHKRIRIHNYWEIARSYIDKSRWSTGKHVDIKIMTHFRSTMERNCIWQNISQKWFYNIRRKVPVRLRVHGVKRAPGHHTIDWSYLPDNHSSINNEVGWSASWPCR